MTPPGKTVLGGRDREQVIEAIKNHPTTDYSPSEIVAVVEALPQATASPVARPPLTLRAIALDRRYSDEYIGNRYRATLEPRTHPRVHDWTDKLHDDRRIT